MGLQRPDQTGHGEEVGAAGELFDHRILQRAGGDMYSQIRGREDRKRPPRHVKHRGAGLGALNGEVARIHLDKAERWVAAEANASDQVLAALDC